MVYQVDDILRDVRVCLDENDDVQALLAEHDIETLSLDALIKSKIEQAVTWVHKRAPYWMLEGSQFKSNTLTFDPDDTCGRVQLPNDYMRLVVFMMSDWERPVYSTISADGEEYAKQRSRFKGIRGTAQRPVCAIGVAEDGNRVLEFYSCKSNEATVERAVYMPYPKVVEDTQTHNKQIAVSKACYDAVVYNMAGLTLTSCGEADRAKSYFDIANMYMER